MDGISRNPPPAAPAPAADTRPAEPAPAATPAPAPRATGYSTWDSFEAGPARASTFSAFQAAPAPAAVSTEPPPVLPEGASLEQRQEHEKEWQKYSEQFRAQGTWELNRKATNYRLPNDEANALLEAGKFQGPHVGGRSTVAGNERSPVFFTDYPDSSNPRMQIYTYLFPPTADPAVQKSWASFEIYGDVLKAYADPTFTQEKTGTNSALGFPESGRENAMQGGTPFMEDPAVQELRASQRAAGKPEEVWYQAFQGGYLVDLGGGKVQGFKKDGTRMGSAYPGGNLSENIAPTGRGSAGKPGSVYAPFEVTPGVSVQGRLGFTWPTNLPLPTDTKVAQGIIDQAKALGAGYTTMVMSPGQETQNLALLKQLEANGITPVVRLFNDKPPDLWGEEDFRAMEQQAKTLADNGVKLIQVGNEPNIEGDLIVDGKPRLDTATYVQRSAERQAEAMLRIRNAVGDGVKLGPPPMSAGSPDDDKGNQAPQTYFPALMRAVADKERASGKQLADWIPTHNYAITDGEEYTNQVGNGDRGARGQLGYGPATNDWYEAEAHKALGRSVRSLSTEGGASPPAFRADDSERVLREMKETLGQLNGDSSLTASLWLLRESARDEWNKSVFLDGEGAWAQGLEHYRQAYAAAR